ncbi:MAG: N-acetylmuramoyl-L-alanine amidase [Clostridiales bacterium]|jgi:N-acetylmuramoyl-L-alanine amidase|nr:N-acetylmuramoyl-L-alanine amidase [Clostridiales bacterium]
MKVFSVSKERIIAAAFCAVIAFSAGSRLRAESLPVHASPAAKKVVVIDAGHGGFDPGKVAGSGAPEKDLNLSVALKLQRYLEQGGSTVIMTRVADEALDGRKAGDMRKRREIANLSHADIIVSVHQNSFPSPNVSGAQVFYFSKSEASKRLAVMIQAELAPHAPKNRQAASNSNYYILKKTDLPAVIVECGFLSNQEDARKLGTDEYQEKIAWGIYKGILRYFEEGLV